MTSKRIRIDVQDKDGAKFDFKIEGNVTREKVLKIFELMDLMKQEDVYQVTSTTSKRPEGGASGIGDVQGFNSTNLNYPVQSATLSDEKMEIDKFFEVSKDLEKHTKKDAKYIVPEPYLSRSTKDPLVAREVRIPDNWIYQNESVMNGGDIGNNLTANDPLKTFYEIL